MKPATRARIEGGHGGQFGPKVTTFLVPKAPKIGKMGLSDQLFGAAGAKNYEKFWRFWKNLFFFAKNEDFIA